MILYAIVHFLFGLIWKKLFKIQIIGLENLPKEGGVIIAANHISNFDPPVVGCAVPLNRQVHFMAKEELFKNWFLGKIFIILGTFSIKRGAPDRKALKTAIDIVSQGKVLGLFPEGTRSKTGKLGEAEPGLAIIANKAGGAIVPTALINTAKIFKEKHSQFQLKVCFGKPIIVRKGELTKEGMQDIGKKIMFEIARMMELEG